MAHVASPFFQQCSDFASRVQRATTIDFQGGARREALNTFIRSSGEFDGVIDFDLAVRDPSNPTQYLSSYQSGDWLHPNDAGYQAMPNAINLRLFDAPYRDSNERD
jgi:lysophospholipase L1-like esterase